MLSRSPASSSSSTRPRSTPSVDVAVVTASVISSVRSWLPSAKRPSAATAFCWRARRASCCAAWVRSVTSRATTSRDSTVSSPARTGTAWTANVSPSLANSKAPPLALQRGVVVLEAELEHVVGDLGVQLGHPAAAEHVRVEEAEAPDRLAVGDQDPQLVIEQEDGRVGQVAGQGPVQRLRVADQLLGLVARGGVGLAVGHVLGGEVQDAVDGDRRPVEERGSRRCGCDSGSRRRRPRRRRGRRRRRTRSSVAATSSGWTKEMNGSAISSSRVQPSQRSQAGLSSVK